MCIDRRASLLPPGLTIAPMVAEIPNTLEKVIGHHDAWTEVDLQSIMLQCVSRITSNVFLGSKFMEDPDWQYLNTEYVKDVNMAARRLNALPPFVRPFIHWFLPECRKIREEVKKARALIGPEVDRRMEELRKHGGPRRRVLDSVDWILASMKGRGKTQFDIPVAEIALSMAAIHTTARTIVCFMRDLLAHPEYVQDLRDEYVAVLKEEGKIDKKALLKMRKMDSVMRESMRMNPASLGKAKPPPPLSQLSTLTSVVCRVLTPPIPVVANMPRIATKDVRFKDGTLIPKGAVSMMYPMPLKNPDIYPEPEKFDGYRFLRARQQPNAENKYQSVTTGPDFTFFGHGSHACPGRFLATNEIKLLVGHFLLHYDWELPKNGELLPGLAMGTFLQPDPRQKALCRSREPEIDTLKYFDLDALDEKTANA